MGKDINFVVISGFTFSDNNRGTSALSYGAVTFLQEKNKIKVGQTIVSFGFKHSLNLLKSPVIKEEKVDINGQKWIHKKYIFLTYLVSYLKTSGGNSGFDLTGKINSLLKQNTANKLEYEKLINNLNNDIKEKDNKINFLNNQIKE